MLGRAGFSGAYQEATRGGVNAFESSFGFD
jgi:hypothetical protein